MHATIAGYVDVEHVGSGIQIKIKRRGLVESAIIHHDLRAFGLGLHAHDSHARIFAMAEDLFELTSGGANFFGTSQRLERQVEIRTLPGFYIDGAGLVEITISPHNNGVSAR